MSKKLLLVVSAIVVAVPAAAFVMSRSMFGSDTARAALAAQLSSVLGQPVTAAGVRVSALGRVTVTLTDVTIGQQPAAVHIDAVDLRAGLLAVFTGRLDAATITLHGARVQLPAPSITLTTPAPDPAPVTLSSVGEIVIDDLQMTTRGRRLRVDAVLVPHGDAVTVREATLSADDMRMTVEGEIRDRRQFQGELTARTNRIDGDLLLALVSEFAERPAGEPADGVEPSPAPAADPASGLAVTVEADRVSLGPLSLTELKGRATIRPEETVFDPVSFKVFSGHYEGQTALRYARATPSIRWYGDLDGIRLDEVMALGDRAGALTGTLKGDVDLTGSGPDFARALQSVRGSARVTIADGSIGKLALVRSILAATSANPQQAAANPGGPDDTAFRTLVSALTISGGSASLVDLGIESDDLHLAGGGGLRLDGSAVTVFADVESSEALSAQMAAGRGRQLAPGSRLTVPATIRGNTARYSVQVDVTEMRAVADQKK